MTYKNFTVETDADGIALVTWDMPDKSMNVFTEEVMDELDAIIDQVAGDDAIKGAVLTSGKKDSFSGGADITMLKKHVRDRPDGEGEKPAESRRDAVRGRGPDERDLPQAGNLRQALGVGDQRHLHGRRAGSVARLSRPCRRGQQSRQDGAAGSQDRHLPGRRRHAARAAPVNQQDALQMMTQGSNLSPSRAKAMGLIHEVVPPKKLIERGKGR
jgi:3-hydroxyacyl-CoA dehydrogenase/enoyl-CoA hydratase/3-hydroxybutyryl-CoA epimerase